MTKRPHSLKKGDHIGLISTAKKISPEEMRRALAVFEGWGLVVETGEHLFSENNQFSGTDEERIYDLQSMLDNPEIRAIICARGGYGTTRIVDKIDFSGLHNDPKWIVGFSDVTAIHCHLHNQGIETVHGIMPILFEVDGVAAAIESLRLTLFGEHELIRCAPHVLNRDGVCTAQVIGGNLTIVANLIGTPSGIDTTGKILFIEDIDEYLYHLDRMMVQLKRAGMLEKLGGLVVGQMTAMNDNQIPFGKDSYEIIKEHVEEYNFPVCFGFPVGHEEGNFAIPCSRVGKFIVSKNMATLEFD